MSNLNSEVKKLLEETKTWVLSKGYQLKGKAIYSKDAVLLEKGNTITSKFKLTAKGALIVEVKDVYVLTPDPDNGKTCA
ncbi:hypothetical protein LQZ18_03510 [Lachnospiraceae bacterium ZAX-1]